MSIFDADKSLTALGRKKRANTVLCDYCNKEGKDIFNKSNPCPFCKGNKIYEKDTNI